MLLNKNYNSIYQKNIKINYIVRFISEELEENRNEKNSLDIIKFYDRIIE